MSECGVILLWLQQNGVYRSCASESFAGSNQIYLRENPHYTLIRISYITAFSIFPYVDNVLRIFNIFSLIFFRVVGWTRRHLEAQTILRLWVIQILLNLQVNASSVVLLSNINSCSISIFACRTFLYLLIKSIYCANSISLVCADV